MMLSLHTMLPRLLLLLLAILAVSVPAAAQQEKRGVMTARRVASPPVIDGVQSEGEWSGVGDTLRQQSPPHGSPSSQRTEVWIAYDDEAIYVAARLYDTDPAAIVGNVGRRDEIIPSDWFEISFDPMHDRRNGFFFRVSAAGGMLDGAITEETRRDFSWNANWRSAVSIDTEGWIAEMEIPLSELRFTARDSQLWGVNAARWIPRVSEYSVFALAPVSLPKSVAYFADLEGLAGITPPSRLELIPFALARLHGYEQVQGDPLHDGSDLAADAGLDLNFTTGSGTRFVATLNPDFGQVEVDPASVNLTTFETTYPEKRPFFVEGAGALKFGDGGSADFFYSRRIGRGIQPEVTGEGFTDIPARARILGALRLNARLGSSPGDAGTLGVLGAVTRREYATIDSAGTIREEEVEPLAVYGVARDQQQFSDGRYGLGFFAGGVGRDLRTERHTSSMSARAFAGGIDGWWNLDTGRRWVVTALGGVSHVEGSPARMRALQRAAQRYFQRPDADHLEVDSSAVSMKGWIASVGVSRQGEALTGSLSLKAISPGFELNDIGILRRADRVTTSGSIDYGWYERDDLFLNRSIGIAASHDRDFDGTDLGSSVSLYGDVQFANAWGGSVSVSHLLPGIDTRSTRGGPAIQGPAGWSGSLSAYTSERSSLSAWADATGSVDAQGSEAFGYGGGISWRPTGTLSLSLAPWWDRSYYPTTFYSRIEDSLATETYGARYIFAGLRQSSSSTELRLNWTPTPRISLQLYVQPYFGDVGYDRYKQLVRARSAEYNRFGEGGTELSEQDGELRIDPDGAGPAAPFTLDNSDFRYRSLRGTLSLGWEYLPGSSVYLVWTELRSTYEDYWTAEESRNQSLFDAEPDDSLVLKVTWLLVP